MQMNSFKTLLYFPEFSNFIWASLIQPSKYFTSFCRIFPENESGIPESIKQEMKDAKDLISLKQYLSETGCPLSRGMTIKRNEFGLLCSLLPLLWIATTMHNCNDHKRLFLYSIIDPEGKPMNYGAACVPVNYSVHIRIV
jgi:hypothetical protein